MVSAVLVTGERQQLPDREEGDPPHLHHQEGRQGTLRSVQVSGHQHSGQGGGGDRTDRCVVTSLLSPLLSPLLTDAAGLPKAPVFQSGVLSKMSDSHRLTWLTESYSTITEYRLRYRKIRVNSPISLMKLTGLSRRRADLPPTSIFSYFEGQL